jgi:uncharacterized protein
VRELDSDFIRSSLEENGYCLLPKLLPANHCASVSKLYESNNYFRRRVVMERHRFGVGEYQYFRKLPKDLEDLRSLLYQNLVDVANSWNSLLRINYQYPARLSTYTRELACRGQTLPASLILKYSTNGSNRLHQDLFGECQFPFQVAVLLSDPLKDFSGGELVLVDNLPRQQSIARSISPGLGDAVVFPNNFRPVKGSRGYSRAKVRHGVSLIRSGERFTLGLVFHNALEN